MDVYMTDKLILVVGLLILINIFSVSILYKNISIVL